MYIYKISDRFILRDIAGIYFAVDIKNKRLYDDKKLINLNKTAYILLKSAVEKKFFTADDLNDSLIKLLGGEFDCAEVKRDIYNFITYAHDKGLIEHYE